MAAIRPLGEHDLLSAMKTELPAYVAAAQTATFDTSDVSLYTEQVLSWWAAHAASLPVWAKAARIVFAISPNSASCERVFSLLKNMFGEEQMVVLADYISAALMLRYNKRSVG